MPHFLQTVTEEFTRQKSAAERALAQMSDEQFFKQPGELVNPAALIVKHIAGNLASRWTDFLNTDGEKPNRDRDSEFILKPDDTRPSLMQKWERGWAILFDSLNTLTPDDLERTIHIRKEPLNAQVAIFRALTHVSYHVGQIAYLMRLLNPSAKWLTIAPGESAKHVGAYLKSAK